MNVKIAAATATFFMYSLCGNLKTQVFDFCTIYPSYTSDLNATLPDKINWLWLIIATYPVSETIVSKYIFERVTLKISIIYHRWRLINLSLYR